MEQQLATLEHADSETLARIRQAQGLPECLRDQYLVPYRNIGELLELRAHQTPEKVFLVYCEEEQDLRQEFTYSQFNVRVNRIANFLTRKLGLQRGDAVGTMMYNHSETVHLYYAAWKMGAIVVPVNIDEDDNRIAFTFSNANCKAVFVRPELAQRLAGFRDSLGEVQHVVQVGGEPADGGTSFVTGSKPSGELPVERRTAEDKEPSPIPGPRPLAPVSGWHWDAELKEQSQEFTPPATVTLEDDALIVYTSGTTGSPKGVVLCHYNLLVDPHSIAGWHGIDEHHTMMCVLPIHHVNGIVVTLMTPLYTGGRTVLNRRPYIGNFWKRLADEHVQIVSVVPTILQYLCEKADDVTLYDLSAFRHFVCGAGTLSMALATRFEEMFKFRIIHGYGLSETTCYDCFLPVDLTDRDHRAWVRDLGYPSIGVPIACNVMAIHDPEGKALPEGVRGEIVIRGHLVMKYYYKRPDANHETFKHGWFRSGDEGFFRTDAAGRPFFFITGRLKELIIRGGVNLSPFEIEEVMNLIPGVKVALAISFDNKWYGEEVGAYVQRECGATVTEQDIISNCRQHLPYSKTPKVVLFGDDIPVTSTGKFQRMKLKQLFKQWEDVQFRE